MTTGAALPISHYLDELDKLLDEFDIIFVSVISRHRPLIHNICG